MLSRALRGSIQRQTSCRHQHHLAGLLGANIGHSVFPATAASVWRELGDDATVELFDLDVTSQTISEIAAEIRDRPFCGVAVTMPCKETVIEHLDSLTPEAEQVGAVNYIQVQRSPEAPVQLIGHNFDHSGISDAFRARLRPGNRLFGDDVCVMGAGGVARAAVFAFHDMGASEIYITDPDYSKACALVEELTASIDSYIFGSELIACTLEDAIGRAPDGIANCSPVGMLGGPTGSPISADMLKKGSPALRWAFDAVCYPPDTPFMRMSKKAGLVTIRGDEMNRHVRLGMFALMTGVEKKRYDLS